MQKCCSSKSLFAIVVSIHVGFSPEYFNLESLLQNENLCPSTHSTCSFLHPDGIQIGTMVLQYSSHHQTISSPINGFNLRSSTVIVELNFNTGWKAIAPSVVMPHCCISRAESNKNIESSLQREAPYHGHLQL